MRPEILFPLFAPVTTLKGIGARVAKLVEKAAGARVVDLLWHLPVGLIDRRHAPTLGEAVPGGIVTLTVTVVQHQPSPDRRYPYRVLCSDDTGFITLTFFHVKGDWVERALPLGATRVISGKLDRYGDQLQMAHPDYMAAPGEIELGIEPVYGLTAGLSLKLMRKAIESILTHLPALPDWQDPEFARRQGWPSWGAALINLHTPEKPEDLEPLTLPRRRLAYDELLADQLGIAMIRAHQKRRAGRMVKGEGRLRQAVIGALPFALTRSQRLALAEIEADLAAPSRMSRLLQGDVGSGKTVVALLAMLAAVESGRQATLMAPTEILARQHIATLQRLGAAAGVEIILLTGRDKGKARNTILARLASGEISILVGTHALFQDDVVFHDLALVVIDEQHRFGVEQRVALASKGQGVDMLVMTATPIPRTLMMTGYGDLDSSRLTEKPAGRQPISTKLVSLDRLDEVVSGVGRAMEGGNKIYWVCPLIEESEDLDVAAVLLRHSLLAELFGTRVGLLHGRMKPADRDQVMERFVHGDLAVLIATTVIEVGVDVPAASIMVIEHAERFGLAQLHQLRGRIGRGSAASTCILLYATPLSAVAEKRLRIMRDSDDGFRIAEEDLRMRGAGEVLGTRQSGLPAYHFADLAVHGDLLEIAHDDAKLVLTRDPELTGERGKALRTLLYLFERDAAVKYLRSG